jgi:uncharacterized protein YceH (UPF0502 family)
VRPTWIRSLTAPETRVLGCLLEKQRTTPDTYPLSLNSLRLACNQSTNREPVVDYDEAVIRDALHRLERRGIVRLAGASRAAKYRHLLAEALPMQDGEQAIVCVLMLRGPQTPGELKQRTERMHPFADLDGVHETLERLIDRELVQRLERRPGQKEERYVQLLEQEEGEMGRPPAPGVGAPGPSQSTYTPPPPSSPSNHLLDTPGHPDSSTPSNTAHLMGAAGGSAIEDLYERVERLEREVAELRAQTGDAVGEPSP